MFSSLGWPEIAVLIVVALFIFGPDKLPGAAKQAGEALRGLRKQITGAKKQIKEELGDEMPDFDRDLLNPRAFVRKHLWDDLETDNEPSGRGATVVSKEPAKPAPFDSEAT
ncbi:sec-independent translocase [Blastococcus sp. Marseille-P5729]|uniref:sec-independent translocase n=1 Tax=Blastococcus sp. Marseille-P5729 TaxID=2086582 RepID=UPI000D101910|nr:sec-independent translocase [Blastococcus sp. Marseille-P5729]